MKELYETNEEQEVPKEDVIDFVKDNKEYYREKFTQMKNNNMPISWNWGAFLFSGFWFLYRKMYLPAAIILLTDTLMTNMTGSRLTTWIISLLCGIFANYQYLDYCENRVSKINKLDCEEKQKRLSKQGGVSMISVIIGFILIYMVALAYAYCTK